MKVPTWLLVLGAVALVSNKGSATRKPATPASSPPTPPPAGPLSLEQGKTYQATITLTGIEAMLGSAKAVHDKLTAAGFTNVLVTDQGGGKFLARGVWSKPSTTAKLPNQVKAVALVP